MTIYCAFCPAEAVRYAVHRKGTDDWSQDHKTPLCCACGEVYECGSVNPHVEWQNIDSADNDEEEE